MSLQPRLPDDLEVEVSSFFEDIKQGKLAGSLPLSMATVKLIKRLVGQGAWGNARDLMELLRRRLGKRCQEDPGKAVVGNLVRRVLKLIREEHATASGAKGKREEEQQQQQQEVGLHRMLQSQSVEDDIKDTKDVDEVHLSCVVPSLKGTVLDGVDELLTELEAAADEISNQALEHIHANEVILTLGHSHTVELFLKQAARGDRQFQVIVAESGPPGFRGQEMALSLSKAGIQTIVITDSAIFAMMSRVNKVIVGTAAILADGGLKAPAGIYTAALSARHYSVPLYVCASIAKLTPRYCTSNDLDAFNT